jgi:hypothetical protein
MDFTDLAAAGAPPIVEPANGRFAGADARNEGFYVIGPKAFPGKISLTGQSEKLSYHEQQPMPPEVLALPALLLRRLACPHLPPQTDPTQPLYNPYVTVDSMEGVKLNPGDGSMQPVQNRRSQGRNQPFAAHHSQQHDQSPAPAYTDQPQHTFFRHNSVEAANPQPNAPNQTLVIPFDWLVHLDRPLTSPLELLHVSAFKPHELTEQFMIHEHRFCHLAPWFGALNRLYRFLEFVECRPLSQWAAPLPLTAGKINLNTVWDQAIFKGIADLPPAWQGQLDQIWNELTARRDAANQPFAVGNPMFTVGNPASRPFWGLSVGPQPPGRVGPFPDGTDGINATLLRERTAPRPIDLMWESTAPRLLEVFNPATGQPFDHPFERNRLLNKIWNQLTTRSNVFAVWVTVGFFEVDIQGRLMQELGRADGRHQRHRMFAIVDRSVFDRYVVPTVTNNPYRALDPRRDYSAQGGPPRSVLYWSITE